MKRTTIKKSLEKYDSNKGYGRALKDEPHIKQLRNFYLELKEDNLSPSSLLKLALILIGKKTRTDTSESGKTFEGLINELGGYEVLDSLSAANQLTEDNITFLEKHSAEANALAPIIISISKNKAVTAMINIFNVAEKIKNPKQLIIVFNELAFFSGREHAYYFINALSLLNRYDLYSDEVIPLLKETKHIIFINQILESLAEKNSALITLPNLINILKIKRYCIFIDLFKNLPPNQQSMDSLFQANDTLEQCCWSPDILINFNNAGWDPQPYLETILSGKLYYWELKSATSKLIELKLMAEILPLILDTIFTHSNESVALINAVETLNKEGLDECFLKLAFEAPKYSDRIAAALMTLKKAQCTDKTAFTYVCVSPEYALDLAKFWIQFSKTEGLNPTSRAAMLQQPQCASYTADVLEFLREHKLHSEKNIMALCKLKITNEALLNLLKVMNQINILKEERFLMLLASLPFIKTLYSGVKCLENGEQLNSFNFDKLMSDPINAVASAENLGGKSHPKDHPFIINRGAQDFASIRRNTKLLCQGHRQELFFPEMSLEQRQSFEKERHKTAAETQKDIMVSIAKYSGNQELEEETEHNIAYDTYSSFLMSNQ